MKTVIGSFNIHQNLTCNYYNQSIEMRLISNIIVTKIDKHEN